MFLLTLLDVRAGARAAARRQRSLAIRLPFQGGRYSFVAHLPPAATTHVTSWLLDDAVPRIAEIASRALDNRSRVYELTVRLPSFAFGDGVTMRARLPVTHDLGLAPLFSHSADLSRLVDREKTPPANQDTAVGIIKQDTRIELDEKGVAAAAVTLVGSVIKSTVPMLPHRTVVFDRPFTFAIVENSSQTLLFTGVLVTPGQTGEE